MFTDKAFIADDDALFGASPAAQVATAADDTTTQAHSRAEIGIVVHDGALQVGVGADPDVAAEHGVLAQRGPPFDVAVVADQGRALISAFGSTTAPSPTQIPLRNAKPCTSASTLPSRMSWWARA